MGKLETAILAITLSVYCHTFIALERNKIILYYLILYIVYIKTMGHATMQVELMPKD